MNHHECIRTQRSSALSPDRTGVDRRDAPHSVATMAAVPHRSTSWPERLAAYAVLRRLQALVATWNGVCAVCGQIIDVRPRAPTQQRIARPVAKKRPKRDESLALTAETAQPLPRSSSIAGDAAGRARAGCFRAWRTAPRAWDEESLQGANCGPTWPPPPQAGSATGLRCCVEPARAG
jgi:hypothetical protein